MDVSMNVDKKHQPIKRFQSHDEGALEHLLEETKNDGEAVHTNGNIADEIEEIENGGNN